MMSPDVAIKRNAIITQKAFNITLTVVLCPLATATTPTGGSSSGSSNIGTANKKFNSNNGAHSNGKLI